MRYIRTKDRHHVRGIDAVGNISTSGSVRGMQTLYGWPKGGQVRCGAWVYNVGVAEVERLDAIGLLRGN